MSRLLRPLVFLLSLFPVFASAEVPEYQAVRTSRPDGRTVAVSGLTLTRDAYTLTFSAGAFHFLRAAENRTFGAVFIGEGSYELDPATETERRHLALVTGEKDLETLSDSFQTLILLFTDGTAADIEQHGKSVQASPDAKAVSLWEEHLEHQKKKYQINFHLRLLGDLLNGVPPKDGVFLALVDGKRHPPALLVVDPRGIGNLAAQFGYFGGEEVALISFDDENGGFWYLSASRPVAVAGRGRPLRPLADALHYQIDTKIAPRLEIEGQTLIRLRTSVGGIRVLPIHILPKLRLEQALLKTAGEPIAVGIVQEEVDLGRIARLFRSEVADADAALVFSSPLPAGEPVEVTIRYRGSEVLRSVGESYSVRARESWYPNLGTFTDLATYQLTFRFPKRNSLISVGELVREEAAGNETVSVWKSERPLRIAGFNYGEFRKKSQTDEQSGIRIDVYTSREHTRMADDTLVDAVNTARISSLFFGRAPYQAISVTQQAEWNFGQSWPSLVYLPTLALMTSTERVQTFEDAGPDLFKINEFAKMVGWHEMAHQWWGHLVGWESYRDQWLSEGFSDFTAALVLQMTENSQRYVDYWRRQREEIFARRGAVSNNDAGPVSQGFRLATRRSPRAAQTAMYAKGGYVLHMLRMLMSDSTAPNPDQKFITMMRDFTSTYAGKNPSTLDFQRIVEKHMTPPMNAANNGLMHYFFEQWIHGTEVPKLSSQLKVADAGGGKYRISGSVTQAGVSSDFRVVVPIYAEFGKSTVARLGFVRLTGNTSEPVDVTLPMPKKPTRILINAWSDVLTRD